MAICNFPRLVIVIVCAGILLGFILHSKPGVVPTLEQLQAIAQEYRYAKTSFLCDAINNSRPTCKIPGSGADVAPIELSVRERIHSFFSPVRHSPTEPYIDASGKKFDLKGTRWRDRLGKKILIVDIDTREPKNVNEMLNPNGMNWERLEMGGGQLVSGAIFGHFLYCEY